MVGTELQGLILDAGKESGLLTAEVVDSCRNTKRDKGQQSPLLKLLLERQGLSKADLDRILEKFWASNGSRRAQLHREVEDRLMGQLLISEATCEEAQVDAQLKVREEREKGGQPVRLLSILIDAGSLTEDKARALLDQVQKSWKFCRYCLSTFKLENGSDACGVCGRPLAPVARNYEIVSLTTISSDTAPNKTADGEKAADLPEIGETLAGVKLLEKVDSQGRGIVYRAERASDQAARSVKVWQVGGDLSIDDVTRFESAALSAAKLDHAGILKVYEAGEERGIHFVLAEWVEGKTVKKKVADGGPLDAKQATEVLDGCLKALEAAHKEKLLHKNITPGNIFLLDAGGVKLSDFGVAKDYGVSMETIRGNVIGAPEYLAPEQCEGKKADERTDIFSLGATMYFALTGKQPWEGESGVTTVVKRLTTDPKPISDWAPKTPKDLAQLVEKMMQRKMEDRPASVAVILEQLGKKKEGEAQKKAATGASRKKVAIIFVILLVLAGLGAGGWWLWKHSGPGPEFAAQVADAEAVATRGMYTESTGRLRDLVLAEGIPNGQAAQALDRVARLCCEKSEELAKEKNYEAALDILRGVRPNLSSPVSVSKSDELLKSFEAASAQHNENAKIAYQQLEKDLAAASTPDEAMAKIQTYRKTYPHQPLDQAAAMLEEKAGASVKQLTLMAEAEDAVKAQDGDTAHAKLADLVLTGTLSEKLQKRRDAVDAEIEFQAHMREGDRLRAANEFDKAIGEYQRAAAGRERPEVRAAIANVNYLKWIKKAEEDEQMNDFVAAREHYEKAANEAAAAALDQAPIRKRIEDLQKRANSKKDGETFAKGKFDEGKRLEQQGKFNDALKAYLAAQEKGGTSPALEEAIARCRAQSGTGDQDKAYSEFEVAFKKAPKPADKAALCKDFLDKYPDSTYAPTVREMYDDVRAGAGLGVAAEKVEGLRNGDRRGEFINPIDGSVMVKIPAGKYRRGTSPDISKTLCDRWGVKTTLVVDEAPPKDVAIGAFFLDVYEVTNADYAIFLASIGSDKVNPHKFCHPDEPKDKNHEPLYWTDERWNRADLPVVGVDWWDAFAYAKWAGKRLPTEAEWEYAARGAENRVFPWGDNEEPFYANSAEVWFGKVFDNRDAWRKDFLEKMQKDLQKDKGLTVSGSTFASDRSPFGCIHMAGNVREWCEDWYTKDAYVKSADKDPVQKEQKDATAFKTKDGGQEKHKVVRGGCWNDPLIHLRAASRAYHQRADARTVYVGFRCARSADR